MHMSFSSKVAKNDKTNKFPAFLSTFYPYPAISKKCKENSEFSPLKTPVFSANSTPSTKNAHFSHFSQKLDIQPLPISLHFPTK